MVDMLELGGFVLAFAHNDVHRLDDSKSFSWIDLWSNLIVYMIIGFKRIFLGSCSIYTDCNQTGGKAIGPWVLHLTWHFVDQCAIWESNHFWWNESLRSRATRFDIFCITFIIMYGSQSCCLEEKVYTIQMYRSNLLVSIEYAICKLHPIQSHVILMTSFVALRTLFGALYLSDNRGIAIRSQELAMNLSPEQNVSVRSFSLFLLICSWFS